MTPDQLAALDVARTLAEAGIPIFLAAASPYGTDTVDGFKLPLGWQHARPEDSFAAIDAWRPGDALCMVCGWGLDVIDVDPRNGGSPTALEHIMPRRYAHAATPSGGLHLYVASLGVGKGVLSPGIDIQAGAPDGQGRGFVFLAPTERASKVDGVVRPYVWTDAPLADDLSEWLDTDDSGDLLAARLLAKRPIIGGLTPVIDDGYPFQPPARTFTREQASDYVMPAVRAFAAQGYAGANYNGRLFELALRVGHFVPAFVAVEAAEVMLWQAAVACGCVTAPPGHDYRPMGSRSVRATIRSGLARGMADPYVLDEPRPDGPGKAGDVADVSDSVDSLLAEMLTAEDLMNMPTPRPLVNGVLDLDTTSWLIGKPGSYKSFVALDLAGHVGTGKSWHGRPVTQGQVVYIVAEGVTGTRLRVAAWQQVYGPMTGVRFLPRPVQASNAGAWSVLVEACRRIGPVLVIIDTQARVTVGMDENDNTEMGGYIERADQIKRATGACVLTVHHIGRNGQDARGASAIDGAQDTEMRIERAADRRVTLHMDKAKDSDDTVTIDMELLKVEGGIDPDTLRDLSSLVVVPAGTLPVVISRPWLDSLPEHQAAIIGVIADHAPHAGATKPEVRSLLAERFPMARTSFNTAWDGLIHKEIIVRVEGTQRWVLASMILATGAPESHDVE